MVTYKEKSDCNVSLFHEYLQETTIANVKEFWAAIQILVTCPHYINRSILCTKPILSIKLNNNFSTESLIEFLLSSNKYDAILDNLKLNLASVSYEDISLSEIFDTLGNQDTVENHFIICNENIPKNTNVKYHSFDMILIDKCTKSSYYFAFSKIVDKPGYEITHPFPYALIYLDNVIYLSIYSPAAHNERYVNWLRVKLFSKICSWSKPREIKSSPQNCRSLSLVDHQLYGILYNELKDKYGKAMCQIWPANTDPSKYVYEDIAIATYILLIWKQDILKDKALKKQSFVDLGCGNGLLVHILCSEGHQGYGLDLRKRSLWDKYPSSTILVEKPFIPTIDTFPEVDWLIGNHSDEITPWLPIVATRSSKTCKYFVIPCCPFELNGKKYQRKNSSNTVYDDFLYYVQDISNMCGFETKVDRLRIPSTKRTCLLGWNRDLLTNKFEDICNIMENYVVKECTQITEYVIREKVEKVQNCTQIDRNIQNDIVKIIVGTLLDRKSANKEWNSGGIVSVKELAEIIPKNLLLQLKSEYGGLQTLLKNQNIFNVRSGVVSLNRPKTVHEMKELYFVHKSNDNKTMLKRKSLLPNKHKDKLRKTDDGNIEIFLQKKDCWFFKNHPQGCPLTDNDCSFKHS